MTYKQFEVVEDSNGDKALFDDMFQDPILYLNREDRIEGIDEVCDKLNTWAKLAQNSMILYELLKSNYGELEYFTKDEKELDVGVEKLLRDTKIFLDKYNDEGSCIGYLDYIVDRNVELEKMFRKLVHTARKDGYIGPVELLEVERILKDDW